MQEIDKRNQAKRSKTKNISNRGEILNYPPETL